MALTAKQEKFAQHYAQHRNGSAAYLHAFNVGAETTPAVISNEASKLVNDREISLRVDELIAAADAVSPVTLTIAGAMAKWLEIATADPDELIGLRIGACRHCWSPNHRYQWKVHEYEDAMTKWERDVRKTPDAPMPDIGGGLDYMHNRGPNAACPVCEGRGAERVVARDTSKLSPGAKALYGGVKQTRNGVEVIIADRTKALENLTRMLGGFTDKVRLDGSLSAMVANVQLGEVSQEEAARTYLEMIQRIAVK